MHRRGLRFRREYTIPLSHRRPVKADVAFPRRRVAVFLDGCYWHSCPDHGTKPKANEGYWTAKLARNVQRDREIDDALEAVGWTSIRIWEHEDPHVAASVVAGVVFKTGIPPGQPCW